MQVHMVCPEVPPRVVGGLGRYAERMIRHLASAGVPVEVLGQDSGGDGPRQERHGDVTLHRLGPLTPRALRRPARPGTGRGVRLVVRNLSYSARATFRVLRGPGSVVAVHDWMGCLTGIACRLAGRPVVFHLHSHEMTVGTTWRTRSLLASGLAVLESAQARMATTVVVPTSTMRDLLVARGWPAAKIRVIAHGSGDPELDRAGSGQGTAVRDRYGPGPLLVYAGRLSAAKGVPTLLAAMPALLARVPDCTLVLCGDRSPHTDESTRVATQIERLGLTGRVVALYRFLPAPELYEHFLAADVCVFPSRYEPFGLVAVEAMALGRPVVLGPGYAPELAGDAALRCAGDSAGELADVLHRALTDGAWAAAAGERGRAHVTRTFRWDHTVAETLRCYAEAGRR